ncbi:hypothetical protein [Jannaschia sp. W003]|uniref:hypothetical protein n=1 Tax=Jannaschia sp. W003 TaxID=2867012 RepID=UPI0021A72C2B|nr:hypothetical protein [Jannaschia sp. W003]UWQ23190.1 hypothetical protein K3554_16755 [Jannaschia sp. W003]
MKPDPRPYAARGPSRRRILAAGLAAACLPAVPAAAARGTPGGVVPLAVAPGLAPGSVHVMRGRGLLVLVTGPGTGLGHALRAGPRAADHPADSFLDLHPGAGRIVLHDRVRGPLPFGIAATGDGFVLPRDHLEHLAARLAPGAPAVLYA